MPRHARPPCERCSNATAMVGRRVCVTCGRRLREAGMLWCAHGKHDVPREQLLDRRGIKPMCVQCHADRYHDGVLTDDCVTCGAAMETHLRCTGCGILIGAGHLAQRDYHGYCRSCALAIIRFGRTRPVESDEKES